jgi:hypothetical protein
MEDRLLAEILWAHADSLTRNRNGADYLRLFPDHHKELAPLFELAAKIKEALVPLQVSQAFRIALHNDLLAAARGHRQTGTFFGFSRRNWVIGAALGSAMSIAGVVAYIRRSRAEKAAHLVS